jgi:hypothetical protein
MRYVNKLCPILKTTMQRFKLTILFLTIVTLKSFGQDSTFIEKSGIYTGLSFGTWFPDHKKNVLKNPLLFGFMVDFKGEKNAFGFTFDLVGGFKTQEYKIKFGDSVLTRNDFFGAHLTLDYAREFWNMDRFVFEGICGVGYGRLSYYNPDKDTDIGKSSIVLNPGLSLRYLFGKKSFLLLKVQYCLANYDLKDNISTDLRSNYLTTKLIFGNI